ncbi:MAG: hypothetical protein CVU71_16940 [Deltaproteobacteria bacterium HGW-Deltaproteobacteria-6]|jgi:exonuclease SbcC|nr:MAG: hypothetical protein CVU71_16940 [Deltaproteobacteria bacterium HGW-Deltaproteobacteria-6]
MIKYDYALKTDYDGRIDTYRPDLIPNELPNLVYIEGPNSVGKSTLLHILALSFYGTKNRRIKPALQEKMDNLMNSEHHNISFKIAITDGNNQIELTAEKPDFKTKDIIVRDKNGERLIADTFAKKYNLIYDIPEDPTKRLVELTNEIKDIQLRFEQKIGSLRSRCVDVIRDIKSAKDPMRIKNVKKEKDDLEKAQKETDAKVKKLGEMLKSAKLYMALKFYMKYKKDRDEIKDTVKEIEKSHKENRKIKMQANKEYVALSKQLDDIKENIKTLYCNVTPMLKDYFGRDRQEKNSLLLWNDLIIEEEFRNPDIKQVLKIEGSHFRHLLDELLEEVSKEGDANKAKVFKELIAVLESHVKLNIVIPGTELTISMFIEILRKESENYDAIVSRIENIKHAISMLSDIIEKRELVVNEIIPKLKKAIKKTDTSEKTEDDTEEYREQQIRNRCFAYEEKMKYYEAECLKLNIPEKEIPEMYSSIVLGRAVKELEGISEENLKDRIYNLETTIRTEKNNLSKATGALDFINDELSKLEKRQPHPYHSHLKYLESTLLQIQTMEMNIKNYDGYIIQLISKKIDKENINTGSDVKEKKKYFTHVFNYLGKRVGVIRHINTEYNVVMIDLLNNLIVTKEGITIRLLDMGTGQNQAAFLNALLNVNDGRKIIALFDEVAMMDERSLQPIRDRFRQLCEAGKLLVGIIVQKAENVKVASIN